MKDKDTSRENSNLNEYLNSIDYTLANNEKLGATIIAIGYIGFIYASNIDILDIKDINDTGEIPEGILLTSQKIITLGYILLYSVAQQRVKEKDFRIAYTDENIYLLPYIKVANSYLVSVIGHLLRLNAFAEVYQMVLNEKVNSESEDSQDDD